VSWTAREDAAEAAASILLSDGAYQGPVTVTAEHAPTFEEIAATASELTGHTTRRELMDPEDWAAAQTAAGTPQFMARFLLGFYRAADAGYFSGTDPLLGKLIGRTPQGIRNFLTQTD